MMTLPLRSCTPWLATLALTLLAASAVAQVPQDTTFTGRLVDAQGDPLAGPVNLELRIFDASTGGAQLYSEQHGVALDATGGFSVQLGQGASPSGTFDADLFSDVDRWLEVVVDLEVLTPRQIIGSVPWALVAERANEVVRDPDAPRFEDCGDGTVADHETGLQWEQKTGAWASPGVICESVGCPDPHDVNNRYEWSNTGSVPDGNWLTDFLAKLNDQTFGTAAAYDEVTGCLAGHCDWRLPGMAELDTILDCGAGTPCIDPVFGPTAPYYYWSASTLASASTNAYGADFSSGARLANDKTDDRLVRAVRVGSCR